MGNLGNIIVARGFEKLPKVQKIAQSCHTGAVLYWSSFPLMMRANLKKILPIFVAFAADEQFRAHIFGTEIKN